MRYSTTWVEQILPNLLRLCHQAGAAIMEIYQTDFEVSYKDDRMPVTKADLAAEAIILPYLRAINADWTVVAEEDCSENGVPTQIKDGFWLVDPLDGTKEFLSKNGEFTVNIALIIERKAVLGVIYAPALDRFYFGIKGLGAWRMDGMNMDGMKGDDLSHKQAINAKVQNPNGLIMIASRRHGQLKDQAELLGTHSPIVERLNMGSSLKFCLLAEGKADIYPRLGRTMEWDTAAGQAILEAAGGRVEHLDHTDFLYQKHADFGNPSFLAWGKLGVK